MVKAITEGLRKGEKPETVVTPIGKLTLSRTQKVNIVGEFNDAKKDREAFDKMLHKKGMYDRFTETKFSLDLVKKYCIENKDDLYGRVEIEDSWKPTFTKAKSDEKIMDMEDE